MRYLPCLLVLSLLPGCSVPAAPREDRQPDSGRLAPCPATPNCVSSQTGDENRWIPPLKVPGDLDRAFRRLRDLLASRPDTTIVVERPGYLRVEFRTALGFVDDGEFLLDREQRVIQLRSASRVGYYDLGKNRRRLEEIRKWLDAP